MKGNVLIVLAAGAGKRMGKKIPKALLSIAGKPLLYWTLRAVEKCSAVESVVLTAPRGRTQGFLKKISSWRFKKVRTVVEGGKERTDSTRNALKALPGDCRWVGIHDAARPFLSCGSLRNVFEGARKTGAALLAVRSKDTVKVSQKGRPMIRQTIPRDQCWLAQTPQVFRRDIAEKLHSVPRGARFTDDASIAEHLGYQVALIAGSYENIKITTPGDIPPAERMLSRRSS